MSNKAVIKAIYSYLPTKKLTNEQLAQEFSDWDIDKVYEKTGISIRYLSDKNECASDMGIAASKKLFENENILPTDIDYLIFCTQSPDYFLPASSCIIQTKLGLSTNCGAIDINQGCSGFVYGLSLSKGLIESNCAKNILFITSETYSKFINHHDRSVRAIFSDGAAATWITSIDESNEYIGPFVFGTDGTGVNELIVPAGGLRNPISNETKIERKDETGNIRSDENLYMNGPEIFNFSMKTVPITCNRLLEKAKLMLEEIDYYILHQANKFILERLRKKMKIPEDRFYINLDSYGNTGSASIPMALEFVKRHGQISTGDKVMLIGFGVGYSWAGTIINII